MNGRDQILIFQGSQSLTFLGRLYSSPPDWNRPSVLDLTNVSFATPVICVLYYFYLLKGWPVKMPSYSSVTNYLNWMVNKDVVSPNYIPVLRVKSDQRIETDFRIRSILKNVVTEETLRDLSYVFTELMDNVFDHADSKMDLIIQAQKYPEKKKIELCIIDHGKGIDRSMRENPVYSSFDFQQCFEIALKLKFTSKPHEHSGEGLSSIIKWIIENSKTDAEGLIFSNNHAWICVRTRDSQVKIGIDHKESIIWPGTLVWLTIPFNPPVSLESVWKKIGLSPDLG